LFALHSPWQAFAVLPDAAGGALAGGADAAGDDGVTGADTDSPARHFSTYAFSVIPAD